MADNQKGFDPKVMLKNLTKSITDYGKIMGERSKFKSELLANQMKLKQNWLWKMKEKQASPEYKMQQKLGQIFQQQGQGGDIGEGDVFAQPVQPNVRISKGGYDVNYPSQKEFIYSRIQQKKQRQMPLSEKEKKFEEQYLGIREKETKLTAHQKRTADIKKKEVLATLKQGYSTETEEGKTYAIDFTDRAMAENYIIQNYDVDIADPEIQEALAQYKPSEEIIDEPGWFERVFQKQKYPRKEKFGYTYEKREDGKWHKID